MNHKSFLSWRSLIFLTLAILLPQTVSAQTNYYWQTFAANVAGLGGPQGMGVDSGGDVFIANTFDDTILKATPSGTNWTISAIAGLTGTQGTIDGTNNGARFDGPFSIAVQNSSTLYVADSANNAIRRVQLIGTNWVVTTIAGICDPEVTGFQDGTNQYAQFNAPNGITVDSQGHLFVADTYNDVIREIRPSGTNWITTTIAGNGSPGYVDDTNLNSAFNAPYDVAVDSGDKLFVADYNNNVIREIISIGTNWVTTTIGGNQGDGYGFGDGTNTDSLYNGPASIAVDSLDHVYVADEYNNAIRKISPVGGTNWLSLTIGGSGSNGGTLQDGTNVVAQFSGPEGIAVDLSGNIYVGDTGNDALRVGYLFPPSLNLVLAGNQATISYPASLGTNFGFIVQATTNLTTPVWLNVTNRWLLTTNSIPFNIFGVTNKVPNRYFRLQLP